MIEQERRTHLAKHLFQDASVAQSASDERCQRVWHVHASTPASLGEGEHISQMFLTAGAGGAAGADAGLAHQGEGTFEGRPQPGHFGLEGFSGKGGYCLHRCMYIIIHTYMPIKKRRSKISATRPPNPARQDPRLLLALFLDLLPCRQLWRLPSLRNAAFYDRLFNPIVTLWYFIFQRLQSDSTLQAALADAWTGGADRLRRGLSRRLRSIGHHRLERRPPAPTSGLSATSAGPSGRRVPQTGSQRPLARPARPAPGRKHRAAATLRRHPQRISPSSQSVPQPGLLVPDARGGLFLRPYRRGAGLRLGRPQL